jgi:hypothetical protein
MKQMRRNFRINLNPTLGGHTIQIPGMWPTWPVPPSGRSLKSKPTSAKKETTNNIIINKI